MPVLKKKPKSIHPSERYKLRRKAAAGVKFNFQSGSKKSIIRNAQKIILNPKKVSKNDGESSLMSEKVRPDQHNTRIDMVASELFNLSRKEIRKIMDNTGVWINGKKIWIGGYKVKNGETISIKPLEGQAQLRVIFVCSDYLIIDKPAGVSSENKNSNDSPVLDGIAKLGYDRKSLFLVHRIDKDTRGVMVIARNESAKESLEQLFKLHKIKKIYRARVVGSVTPDKGIIETDILRDWSMANKFQAVPKGKGKEALTYYTTISKQYSPSATTLLECKPRTGRPHQIRVHLASIGHPIIGDKIYNTKYRGEKLDLEAYSISFVWKEKEVSYTRLK